MDIEGKGQAWRDPSGWGLAHCGHANALWPYFLTAPAGGPIVVSFNGKGFRSVAAARRAIEGIVAGRFKVGKRAEVSRGIIFLRVRNADAFGEAV